MSKYNNSNQYTTRLWTGSVEQKEMLTREDAKFIFEQSEKMLKDTIEVGNTIVMRTTTLLTIISGLLIALTGYIITTLRSFETDRLFFIALPATIYLFILIYYSFENIKPAVYMSLGSLPEILLAQIAIDEETVSEKQLVNFYISEFENYQFRIEINIAINRLRWKRYHNILKALLLLPAGMSIAFLLI